MEALREKLEDLIDSIKARFSGSKWWGWASLSFKNMSMEDFNDWIENNASKLFGVLILLVLLFLAWIWYFYIPLKTSTLNIVAQKENIKVLEVAKAEKQKNEQKFKEISDEIIVPKSFNIADLVCFFTKFDKGMIPYVNEPYKLTKMNLDEEQQTFNVEIKWVKYYKSITDILVLLKQYKTLINVNSYSVNAVNEESNWPAVTYYNLTIEGKFISNELPNVEWDIEEDKDKE